MCSVLQLGKLPLAHGGKTEKEYDKFGGQLCIRETIPDFKT